jgi:hypothetical protein
LIWERTEVYSSSHVTVETRASPCCLIVLLYCIVIIRVRSLDTTCLRQTSFRCSRLPFYRSLSQSTCGRAIRQWLSTKSRHDGHVLDSIVHLKRLASGRHEHGGRVFRTAFLAVSSLRHFTSTAALCQHANPPRVLYAIHNAGWTRSPPTHGRDKECCCEG